MGNASEVPSVVANLRAAMADHDNAREALSKRRTEFEKSIETEAMHVRMLAGEVEGLKNEVRPLAIAEYQATTHKKMWGGIGIQEKSSMTFDAVKALAFAKEKDMFLKLDDAAFKKVAPGLGLEFVKVEKVTAVTFPKEWKS